MASGVADLHVRVGIFVRVGWQPQYLLDLGEIVIDADRRRSRMRSDLILTLDRRIRDELAPQRRLGVARRTASASLPRLKRTTLLLRKRPAVSRRPIPPSQNPFAAPARSMWPNPFNGERAKQLSTRRRWSPRNVLPVSLWGG